LIDAGNRETMPLVEKIRSVGIAEVELVVEVDTLRHQVLGESICSLKPETSAEAPLSLHEERVVVVEAGCDQRVDLAEVGIDSAFLQQSRVEGGQCYLRSVAVVDLCRSLRAEDVSGLASRQHQIHVVCTGG